MSADQKRRDEKEPPGILGPIDLARALLSWIVVAIVTLIVVWVLVFAATRGDLVGLLIAISVGVFLVGTALVRRRRR